MCALLQKTLFYIQKKSSNYASRKCIMYIIFIQFIRGKNGKVQKKDDKNKKKFNTLRISRAFVRPTIS